jgi:regulator of replication initiation timing
MVQSGNMSTVANIPANGGQGSVNEIVDLLQAKLDELLQQKAAIRLHMRNLRRRLGILRANSNNGRATRPNARRTRNQAQRAESRKVCHLHEELARACRIAFLELGETATPDELYAAIQRRGSFSFSLLEEKPESAVLRILTTMGERHEAVRGSNSRWTYKADSLHR